MSGLLAMMTRRLAKLAPRARPSLRLAIEPREHARRHAQVIEQDAAEIAQAPHEIAFAPVSLAARHRARFQHDQLPPLQPAHEVDILHERQRAEAAEPPVETAR